MHSVHILCFIVCLHWNVYVKNTASKQCQTYMVFYLYENLPNKLTYGKEPETKKTGQLKCSKFLTFKKNDI